MSAVSTRPGYVSHYTRAGIIQMSGKEALEKTLAAVKGKPGLIHGKFKNGGRCALGALHEAAGDCSMPTPIADAIQEANDSVPEKSDAERRDFMIGWLEGKLAQLEDKP